LVGRTLGVGGAPPLAGDCPLLGGIHGGKSAEALLCHRSVPFSWSCGREEESCKLPCRQHLLLFRNAKTMPAVEAIAALRTGFPAPAVMQWHTAEQGPEPSAASSLLEHPWKGLSDLP